MDDREVIACDESLFSANMVVICVPSSWGRSLISPFLIDESPNDDDPIITNRLRIVFPREGKLQL